MSATYFHCCPRDSDPELLLDPRNQFTEPWHGHGHGPCDKCGGKGKARYACRSCEEIGADSSCPACQGRVRFEETCPACIGDGVIDHTVRRGIAVFPSREGLYRYLAERDDQLEAKVVVELRGELSDERDLDAGGSPRPHRRRGFDASKLDTYTLRFHTVPHTRTTPATGISRGGFEMAIVRWDPGRDLDLLQSDVNRLFDAFFGARGTTRNGGPGRWVPAMDLTEEEDRYVLRADLPGLNEDDIEIEVKDDVLTISGERRYEHENRHEGFHRVERSFGRFSRSLDLPSGIEADALRAEFDRGVLEVQIPKPEQSSPTKVPIGSRGDAG